MTTTAEDFHIIGSTYIVGQRPKVSMRIFKAHFKLQPVGYEKLWDRLQQFVLPNDQATVNEVPFSKIIPNHLLWVIHYAYTYSNSDVCASFFGVTRKTFLNYVWALFSFLS